LDEVCVYRCETQIALEQFFYGAGELASMFDDGDRESRRCKQPLDRLSGASIRQYHGAIARHSPCGFIDYSL